MVGAGSTTPTVVLITPGTGQDLNLEDEAQGDRPRGRQVDQLGLQMELSFRNEDKDGARLWGRGYDCASYVCAGTQNAANTKWAVLMVPSR